MGRSTEHAQDSQLSVRSFEPVAPSSAGWLAALAALASWPRRAAA